VVLARDPDPGVDHPHGHPRAGHRLAAAARGRASVQHLTGDHDAPARSVNFTAFESRFARSAARAARAQVRRGGAAAGLLERDAPVRRGRPDHATAPRTAPRTAQRCRATVICPASIFDRSSTSSMSASSCRPLAAIRST
jgi:hypothetical protein